MQRPSNKDIPLFYIQEDMSSEDVNNNVNQSANQISIVKRNKKANRVTSIISNSSQASNKSSDSIALNSPIMTMKDQFNNRLDILKFPIESTHSYSYAHLSPNSLALRLNVLKRSLEILKDRPKLMNALSSVFELDTENISPPSNFYQRPFSLSNEDLSVARAKRNEAANSIESTASSPSSSFNGTNSTSQSPALSALFKPKVKRSDSLPVDQIFSLKPSKSKLNPEFHDQIFEDDLKDIVELLDQNDVNITKDKDFASTLHDLSLTQDENEHRLKYDLIRNRLLHALATPFVDTSVMTTSDKNNSLPSLRQVSSAALNILNNPTAPLNTNNRPFHSVSLGKHASPQSIFTIDYESPWQVKAANDLACLMFGVLKTMIRSLTLMDLIAPQFREFVSDRLARSAQGNPKFQAILPNTDIIFSGEVVAISRPGDQQYAWTSLWAKRKNNLIIFMFDQIPCDAFDIIISKPEQKNSLDFNITSIKEVAGNMVSQFDQPNLHLSTISDSINDFLHGEMTPQEADNYELSYSQSERLNTRRYFTLQMNDDQNIPCAITSSPLTMNPKNMEIKLKVHSLPYIAGMVVIDASNFNILSCNNAIARNLFGWSALDLTGKPIDLIINKFSSIFTIGIEDYNSKFPTVPGLVLPEHFFRKYNCVLETNHGTQSEIEDAYIKSNGLEAKHIDGHKIYVDIQLRVSALDTYVLWITYSRRATTRPSSDTRQEVSGKLWQQMNKPEYSRSRLISGDYHAGFVSLPSQLKLFDQHSSLVATTGEITRHNSTRRPNWKNNVKSTLLLMNNDNNTNDEAYGGHERQLSMTGSTTTEDSNLNSTTRSSFDTKISIISEDEDKLTSMLKFSEQEMLQEESDLIAKKAHECSHWPKAIGERRRNKKITEFDIVRDMGEGAYGKVVLAQHKHDSPYTVIIKCIDKERILVDTWVRDRDLGTIPSEIQIMSTLMREPHVNIMRIIDFFEDDKYYYLETPIFGDPPAIDLFDYIEVRKGMSEHQCQSIFKQIVLAVYHLHKHGIVHRDIKDENVIVDERGIIKLIDFGSAGYTKLGPFDVFVGTIDYASPEVLRGEKYEGKPQDIWALGILLYTMLYKENPFYNVDEIMEGDLNLPYIISESSMLLIKTILVRDIDSRPSITDIMEHHWLQN